MPVLDSPDRSASPGSPGSPAVNSRGAALAVLSAGTLMIILDGTIVNVALPSIQRDLGFSQANLAWVVNAYLIAFAGLLLLSGRATCSAGAASWSEGSPPSPSRRSCAGSRTPPDS
jgi:hypothetical protein